MTENEAQVSINLDKPIFKKKTIVTREPNFETKNQAKHKNKFTKHLNDDKAGNKTNRRVPKKNSKPSINQDQSGNNLENAINVKNKGKPYLGTENGSSADNNKPNVQKFNNKAKPFVRNEQKKFENGPLKTAQKNPVFTNGKTSKLSSKERNKKFFSPVPKIPIVKPQKKTDSKKTFRRNDSNMNNFTGSTKREATPKLIQHGNTPEYQLETLDPSVNPYLLKLERLKNLIYNTSPKKPILNFDSMKEYFNHFTYNLFLEELYDTDFFTDIEIEWTESETFSVIASTKKLFDQYVSPDMQHLKKHPFSREQPIFIIRKTDMGLDSTSKLTFWATCVSRSKLDEGKGKGKGKGKGRVKYRKPAKHAVVKKDKQTSEIVLEAYDWNEFPLPKRERGDQFAILPGSVVTGRILNSMKNFKNPFFENLVLGKQPIKKIVFNNRISGLKNKLNDSQKQALESALNNRITVLKGPPGSGKTSTIYEIILQLIDQLHYYPILVVAASNLAVDNIAEKLLHDYKDDILRITSVTKESEYPPENPIGAVCLHNKITKMLPRDLQIIQRRLKVDRKNVSSAEFDKFLVASKEKSDQLVKQAKIIFSTTVGIAGPYLKSVKKMPVIIMDEATQSSEPASLIPLGAPNCQKVIFVGDEAQLSAFTRVKTLEMSLFERVLKNGTYPEPFMLDTQYRMHPDISEFPRNRFYDGKLKDGITAAQRTLPGISYPVFFFDHKGVGAVESRQFSKFGEEFGFSLVNRKEVQYIERIMEKLIVDKQVKPSDIGIMTGYAAQRDLIAEALERNILINPNHKKQRRIIDKEDLDKDKNVTICNVNGIIISTVDAFQGREKNFVIMSCVRSNSECQIGFMKDTRRMNVAFTRAKYSFIMCGNAECLLNGDPLWRDYINMLKEKNAVKNSFDSY